MTHRRTSDPNRRLGRNFIIAAWLMGFALVFVLFDGWFERQDHPNRNLETAAVSGPATVRLRQNRQGHYVAPGEINGEPVTFLLDTGATEVSIPGTLARRLGLRSGRARNTTTANGTITTYGTRLDAVKVGPIVLRGVNAHINPHISGEGVLLGMSFLRHLDFEQSGRNLTLRQR